MLEYEENLPIELKNSLARLSWAIADKEHDYYPLNFTKKQ
jgi:hypothetical protein